MVKYLDDPKLHDVNRELRRIEVGGLVFSGKLALYGLMLPRSQKDLSRRLTDQLRAEASSPSLHRAATFAATPSPFAPPPLPAARRALSAPSDPLAPPKRMRADSESTMHSSTTAGGTSSARQLEIKRHVAFILTLNDFIASDDYDLSDTPESSFVPMSVTAAYVEVKSFLEMVLRQGGRTNILDSMFEAMRNTVNVWSVKNTSVCKYVIEDDDEHPLVQGGEHLTLLFYNRSELKRVLVLHLTMRSVDLEDSQLRERNSYSPVNGFDGGGGGARSGTPFSRDSQEEEEEGYDQECSSDEDSG
jgi:hypothetical protein